MSTDLRVGLIAAAVAALAWGTYMVPLKRQPHWSPLAFMLWSCVGIVASSLLWGLVRGSPILQPWGLISGSAWTVGAVLSFNAVAREGLAQASTRWMGTGILLSILAGLLFFEERLHIVLGMLGIVGIMGGLVWISRPIQAPGQLQKSPPSKLPWRSLLAGVVFGLYLIPLKISQIAPLDFVLPMGMGVGLGALGFASYQWTKAGAFSSKDMVFWGIGAGLLWNVANVSSFLAIESLGYAVGFPLTQMALLVSIFWGVMFFGEAPTRTHLRRLGVAAVLLLGGALCLALGRI